MKRLSLPLSLILLTFLSLFQPAYAQQRRTASSTPYTLNVTLDGLIAFVQQTIDGNPAAWAILVAADYDPLTVKFGDDTIPLCADPAASGFSQDFPPHIAALRFKGASVTLNGVSIGGLMPIFFINGLDISFETGHKTPQINLKSIVSRSVFNDLLGGSSADNYKAYDTIKPEYIDPNFGLALAQKHLAARVLLNFGDKIEVANCTGRFYGMQEPRGACQGSTELPESVKVTQTGLIDPVIIRLDSVRTLRAKPIVPGGIVTVEVLNILPSALADPHYDGCKDNHVHLPAFRWYYTLLQDVPTPADCSKHYFPCQSTSTTAGGTKCPQIEMQIP
ncbi:MAG: hypothetical protein WAM82_18235 [Thermoanaerobaculia bacterium]